MSTHADRPTKAKRKLFEEIAEGFEDLRLEREGKRTLRHLKPLPRPLPPVTPAVLREACRKLNVSQGAFARLLRVNPRTLERWAQGGKPNDQAAALIWLVHEYPDTVQRLDAIAERHARSPSRPADR